MMHYDLEKAVVCEWLVRAVARRLKRGRELAHLDDDALQAISARCRSHIGSAQVSTMHLQEAFLGRLAEAEIAERERDGSKHQRLNAIKQAKPLLQLLDAESADAEREDAPHLKASEHLHNGVAGKVPEETRRIYAYRAYHDARRDGFPLFNVWGEPWPKRGRRKRAAADSKEVAKAG